MKQVTKERLLKSKKGQAVKIGGIYYNFKPYEDILLGLKNVEGRTIVVDENGERIGSFEKKIKSVSDLCYGIYDSVNDEIGRYCEDFVCKKYGCREENICKNIKNPIIYLLRNYKNELVK